VLQKWIWSQVLLWFGEEETAEEEREECDIFPEIILMFINFFKGARAFTCFLQAKEHKVKLQVAIARRNKGCLINVKYNRIKDFPGKKDNYDLSVLSWCCVHGGLLNLKQLTVTRNRKYSSMQRDA
jgi:hypothetical protein